MPDPTYPPKPERMPMAHANDPEETAWNGGHNTALLMCEAHYEPQIATLKARIAELEGVLGELVRAVDNAREREPAVTKDPGYIFHEIPQPLAAAKATLAPTTSGEEV